MVDLKIVPEQKFVLVLTETSIIHVTHNKQVAKFKILCSFEIGDFDNIFIKKDNNTYNTPIELEVILKSTGLSTIRGIIHSEVRGTYLHGIVLPLIDVNTLIRNQVKEEEKNNIK